jgi:beta-galactosidase
LVVGARTGTKDLSNNVVKETAPGCLAGLCGVTVAEYSKINARQGPKMQLGDEHLASQFWMEALAPSADTEVLAVWTESHLERTPAVTLRKLGQGVVVYVGTYFTPDLVQVLVSEIAKWVPIRPLWPKCPSGVEVTLRCGPQARVWFFINHQSAPALLCDVPRGKYFLDGKIQQEGLLLQPREVVAIVQV